MCHKDRYHEAYDSVSREFLLKIMAAMDFPVKFINWIFQCVTTASYYFVVNGELAGLLQGTERVKAMGSISPCLFLIVTEGLFGLLNYIMSAMAVLIPP